MNKGISTLALLALLSACGGGDEGTNPIWGGGGGVNPPVDPTDPTDPTEPPPASGIPAGLARNVSYMAYNAGAGTLQIRLTGLADDDVVATFTRRAALDTAGYAAFVVQDDPLDRMFTALAATSFDGSVTAGVTADGGQFTKYFPGGYYVANDAYVAPTVGGLASFAGDYAAVTNLNADGNALLPVPVGTPAAVIPGQAARIQGKIFINIQFGENQLNGAIYDRAYTADSGGTSLEDIFLLPTALTAAGTFAGTVGKGDHTVIGSYGGTLGGNGGTAIAGLVSTVDYDSTNASALEEETGVFVLTRCGLPGANTAACSVAEALGQ